MTDAHKQTLDYMIEEKMADIYHLLKEELEVKSDSAQERILYDACQDFKNKIEELKSQVEYINDITSYNK
jgi:hypothetical protein